MKSVRKRKLLQLIRERNEAIEDVLMIRIQHLRYLAIEAEVELLDFEKEDLQKDIEHWTRHLERLRNGEYNCIQLPNDLYLAMLPDEEFKKLSDRYPESKEPRIQ